jgi:sulfur-oxidizing protein SoxZ
MAFARVQIPAAVKRGVPFEVRISIRHPMETGFRVDDSGRTIPRNTLREFVCKYNGVDVFRASLGSGIAANPYLRFFVMAVDSGELAFEWLDDMGERGDTKAQVAVTA